jgi:hypothetical protein
MNIVHEIREEIRAASRIPSSRDLTILALLFLVIPGLIGAYLLWKGSSNGWIWITIGTSLAISRLVSPLFLLIYKIWVGFSVILGYFVSRILLTLIFFLLITPIGLLMRLTGKDPMERKIDKDAASYWMAKEQESDLTIDRYEKQF